MKNFVKSLAITLILMVSFVQLSFLFIANIHSVENCEMDTECFLEISSVNMDAALFSTLLFAAPVFFVLTLIVLKVWSVGQVSFDLPPLLRQHFLQGVVQRE